MATTNEMIGKKKTLTISETAGELGMPVMEVERLIAEGKLATTTVNGVILTSPDAIEDYRKAFQRPPGTNF